MFIGIASIVLVWPAWRSDPPPTVAGGVLLFTEHELPLGSKATGVEASTQSGGYGSWLQLKFTLGGSPRGERWYLVASGDWAPTEGLDLDNYCSRGNAAHRAGNVVTCDDDGAWGGSSAGEYRFNEGIAMAFEGQTYPISDSHDYYDRNTSVVITGTVEDPDQPIRVGIPYKERRPSTSGSNTSYGYSGILVDDFEYGWGPDHDGELNGPFDYTGYALSAERTPLYEVSIGDTEFSASAPIGDGAVTQANPVLDDPNRLRWTNEGGIADTYFTIHDARAEQRQAVRTFFAGIALSVSTALAVLLLERFLLLRDRRKPS